jgi:CubicO group peptidase (beta-lactamase class C family)
MHLKIQIFLFIIVFTNVSVNGQNFSKNLDQFLNSKIPSDHPGLAVLVWNKGRIAYVNGFGKERLDATARIGAESLFRMASVSKQFTAMSILLLEKQGKLTLDDRLSRFFPEFNPELAERITLKHLLTHTSCIPDYENLMDSTWHR